MNHIYRIVWNYATACYQAATASAKGQGKGSEKNKDKRTATALCAALRHCGPQVHPALQTPQAAKSP
jgi:hypothetical protein